MKFKHFQAFMCASILLANYAAAAPAKDTLVVTAQTSFGSAGAFTPSVPGNATNQWFYTFSAPSGSAVNETFPVQFQLNDTDSHPGDNPSISLGAAGALQSSVTVPVPFNILDNGSPLVQNIVLSTGALAKGEYDVNVHVSGPANSVAISQDTVHIHIHVYDDPTDPSCFFTDSSFNDLTDCSGNAISASSGGTFQIVANSKNIAVSTNPGQFYYNLIWPNTGATRSVQISLAQTGLLPTGANAVHAMAFNSTGFTADHFNWDMVNQNGTPCGPAGPCTVTVNAGETLWVTWHVQYSGIGLTAVGTSLSCPGNQPVTATGTILDAITTQTIASCGSSASGYLKK